MAARASSSLEQLHAYYGAQQQLSDAKLLQQTATVMCSEGQHAVLVRAAIGVDPIPSPFELGAVFRLNRPRN